MGQADDPMAVVDESFRVHGIQNLFVVDASVMPVIPSANTNLPTLMLPKSRLSESGVAKGELERSDDTSCHCNLGQFENGGVFA